MENKEESTNHESIEPSNQLDKGNSNDDTASTNSIVNDCEEKFKSIQNDYLYLRAEFDNFRKRTIKERADLIKYGSERLITQFLNITDDFERSLEIEITKESFESFKNGIEMIAKQIRTILSQFGVEEVKCLHEPFDPTIHEALGSEETNEVPPGHVVKILKKPYRLHDKILRPAQVIVAKEKS